MLSVQKILFLSILIELSISYDSIKMKEEREKMIKVLKENLKKVPDEVPDENLRFLRNPVSTAIIIVDYAPIGDLNIIKKKYNFPDEVLQAFRKVYKLKGVVGYSQIDEKIMKGNSMVYRFFGVGKRSDDKIIFTIVEDITRSELIPRYERVQREKCSKILFWEDCHTITEYIAKGYTTNDLDEIKKGLEIVSSIGIKKKIFGLKKEFVIVLTNNNEMYSLSGQKALRIENGLGIIFSVKDREIIKKGVQAFTVFGQISDPERGPYSLVVKEDGNIIIVDYENGVVWESNTRDKGKAPYNTILTEDGIFILVDSKNKPIYDSQNRYKPFNYILVQEYRIYSENSNYYALIQLDGGVCVYSNGRDGKDSKEFYPYLVLNKKLFVLILLLLILME